MKGICLFQYMYTHTHLLPLIRAEIGSWEPVIFTVASLFCVQLKLLSSVKWCKILMGRKLASHRDRRLLNIKGRVVKNKTSYLDLLF